MKTRIHSETGHSAFSKTAVPTTPARWWRSAAVAIVLVMAVGQLQPIEADENSHSDLRVTIRLVREARISARDAGILAQMNVREGDSVKQGQVIAELDSEQQDLNVAAVELNTQVADLRADDNTAVESAMAQLLEAKSARRVKEIALQISEAEAKTDVPVQIARAETKLRQMELDRATSARRSFEGSIPQAQIDRLQTAVSKGQLEIHQAENDLEVKRMKPDAERAAIQQKDDEIRRYEALVGQTKNERVVAQLTRDLRKNELQVARLNRERRNIRAPFDGVVVEIPGAEGEWVEQGAVVARLIDLATLRAEGFLPAQQASQQLVGRPVAIRLTVGGQQQILKGTVTMISPEVDPVNQQVRFRAEFENANRQILPGMNGLLTIKTN